MIKIQYMWHMCKHIISQPQQVPSLAYLLSAALQNDLQLHLCIHVGIAVTTDNTPAMVGRQKGTVKLIEEKVGHPIMKLDCIIYQISMKLWPWCQRLLPS